MYCIYCGKQIKDNSKFCTFCGARMDEEEDKTEVILTPEPTEVSEPVAVYEAEDKTEILVSPEPVARPVEENKTELLVESDETEVLVESDKTEVLMENSTEVLGAPTAASNMQIQRPLKYMGHVIDEANVSYTMASKEKTMKKMAGGMVGLMLFLLLVVLGLGAWGFYAYINFKA